MSAEMAGGAAAAEPQLRKSLASRHVTMITIGGIIGAGLFVGSSAGIATVGPAIVISYLIAGVIILLVMRMLGEMAVSNPGLGSFTEYSRMGLGDWAGFVSGWLYWYFWVVVVAIEAIAGAAIINLWIDLPVWQIGLVLMIILTAVNLMSARSYGEFEFWFASIKVAAIIAFIVITASYVFGLTSPNGADFSNLYAHQGFAPFGIAAVLAGVTSVIFSLVGGEITTIAAAESNEPTKQISRMTSTIVLRILLFYVISIALIVAVMPWTDIKAGTSPFAAALTHIGIPSAALIMNFVVLTAVLSCLNSGLFVTSRVLFVLAAKGEAPKSMVALNARGVPSRAILIGTVFGYLAVIASIVSPQVVFAFLVNASGAIMLVVYLITCFAQIKLRRQTEASAPEKLTIKLWFFPWSSYLAIAGIVIILVAMAFAPDLASQLYASLFCVAVVFACYAFHKRRLTAS